MKKNNVNNKTIRTDLKFSVSGMAIIATLAILAIGSTATTNVHAQIDCSANPDDPSCQGNSGSTDNSGSSSSNTQTTTCSDGSQPDSNGNCPPAPQPNNPIVGAVKNHICGAVGAAIGGARGGAAGTAALPGIGTIGGVHQGAIAGGAAGEYLCSK
jgi:hypothetical protein